MLQRLFYGLFGSILFIFIGYKVWRETTLSPQTIMDISYARNQNLDGKGVVVAVLDEGFDSSHRSLQSTLSPYRYNTVNKTRDVSESLIFADGVYQFESHGTHVTGIISNLAPQVTIIPIKLDGFGGDQVFVKALHIAALSPAQIVNISMRLSYTGREISPNVRKALIDLAETGKLIVISAGNESSPLMKSPYTASLIELAHDPQMKGRLLLAGASSYKNGTEALAEFSNYPGSLSFGSEQSYFITAPGDRITSTITGNLFGEKSGTSMAAPMVVGAASLVKQAFPYLKAEDIVFLLLTSARKVSLNGTDLSPHEFGAGVINLKSALEQGKFF